MPYFRILVGDFAFRFAQLPVLRRELAKERVAHSAQENAYTRLAGGCCAAGRRSRARRITTGACADGARYVRSKARQS
jgi:hypothetical protein